MRRPRYAELHAHSAFSFLEGASPVEELVARAHALGYEALALTDRDGVYGAPTLHEAAREVGLRPLFGAEVTLLSGHHVTLLVENEEGWSNLCRLLTRGRLRSPKGKCAVSFDELAGHARGLVALSGCPRGEIPSRLCAADDRAERDGRDIALRYLDTFGRGNFFLELQHHLRDGDAERNARLERLGRRLDVPCVATGNVHHAAAGDRRVQDVLTAIRHRVPLDRAGALLFGNAERHLRPIPVLARLFRDHPGALERTVEIARRLRFSLDRLRYRLPSFPVPEGETPFSYLHRIVHEGARRRYRPLTPRAARQIAHELDVIERLELAGYFLIVWDIVRFARGQGILCQGRGSAANSAVCYCLGITAVDPVGLDLLFERFLSEERRETPDIDLDIAHRDRERVLHYVYERYGRDHAGMVCEFVTYRGRSAIRDAAKALGFAADEIEHAQRTLRDLREGVAPPHDDRIDLRSPRLRLLEEVSRKMEGLPRHLSIHVGGMIVTDRPLAEVVPIENATMPGRTVVQWDKDDCARLGIVKIDLLGLGMLTVLQDAIRLVREHEGVEIDLARLEPDDPEVYDLLCRADTVGVFQVESRAQMNTLPRLKPRCFYDLVVEVALIRPGPIQGEMVHPYLRRRAGREKVAYPHPKLKPILERTLGVPLFQEQGMRVAVEAAGFTPSEADELRRAMGHRRSRERMRRLARRLVDGMRRNGIPAEAAARILRQLASFADYGFPESHAASFALLVYASAYLKRYHPAAFTCALLNAQPMGFYSPATILHDARRHGVRVLPIDAARSAWRAVLEGDAVRLGIGCVRGAGEAHEGAFERARRERPFASLEDFAARSGLPRTALENLALVGAFASFGLDPRAALWRLQGVLPRPPGPLAAARRPEPEVRWPPLDEVERVALDYSLAGVSPSRHPLAPFRDRLARIGVLPAADLVRRRDRERVRAAGLVLCRQRPPTAHGFTFLTLEDETGFVNVVVAPKVEARHRRAVREAPFLAVEGILEKRDGVTNLRAERVAPLTLGRDLSAPRSRDFR